MSDDRATNRACLAALEARGTTDGDGPGLWAGAAENARALLATTEWTDDDSWTALHVAAYHLPQLKELGLAPVEPEAEPAQVPSAVANQYTAWWGPVDAVRISRRRAREARIAAGQEAQPEHYVPSTRFARPVPGATARVEAVKGHLVVRGGGRLPMVQNTLRRFIRHQVRNDFQLNLGDGVGDALRLLVVKEPRLSVTAEASELVAHHLNQLRETRLPKAQPAPEADGSADAAGAGVEGETESSPATP